MSLVAEDAVKHGCATTALDVAPAPDRAYEESDDLGACHALRLGIPISAVMWTGIIAGTAAVL